MQMRSRSSRLFIVLLHLVGVSTNLPKHYSQYVWNGIVGVHPVDILSETLELHAVGGLNGLLSRLPEAYRDALLSQPYWLQDDIDGRCLGPMGFSECGDATLWLVRRRNGIEVSVTEESNSESTKQSKRPRGLFSLILPSQIYESQQRETKDWGYALQLVNIETHSSDSQRNEKRDEWRRIKDCLLAKKSGRTTGAAEDIGDPLRLGRCSDSQAWNWQIDGKGILSKELYGKSTRHSSSAVCLWREVNATAAFTAPCQEQHRNDSDDALQRRIVGLSLIRFQSSPSVAHGNSPMMLEDASNNDTAAVASKDTASVSQQSDSNIANSAAVALSSDQTSTTTSSDDSFDETMYTMLTPFTTYEKKPLPHTMTLSEAHAHTAHHTDLEPMSSLIFTPLSVARTASLAPPTKASTVASSGSKPSSPLLPSRGGKLEGPASLGTIKGKVSMTTPLKASGQQIHAMKRQIPVHPYIEAAKNQVWVDPQTGLEFLTDLCEYLGHDRKESGRHTLMGVGQYVKTVFNVKVYGVALYVSKRDVLADPTFAKFALFTTQQLQDSAEFYSYLRSAPTSTEGHIDRTLLVKINMQLGTDTMRSSMEADWKMLTDADKDALISSSFKARPASERMLKKIMSDDNPSRCSCAQIAPEEYGADPSCCARGTELVFTWRKNNELEVRLDGDLMDTFSQPSLASGMFYEYLRTDDPISPDARSHFADGFPFLLAPLAQVKGVHMPHTTTTEQQHTPPPSRQGRFNLNPPQFIGDAISATTGLVGGAITWTRTHIDHSLSEIANTPKAVVSGIANAPKAVEQSFRGAAEFMDKRRKEATHHITSFSTHSLKFLAHRIPFIPKEWGEQPLGNSIAIQEWSNLHKILPNQSQSARSSCDANQRTCNDQSASDSGDFNFAGSSLPLFDEIGVIITPALDFTHRLYLYMVHLYLMLLLIVSFPESHNTKTRLVVTRRKHLRKDGAVRAVRSIGKWDLSLQVTLGKGKTIATNASGSDEKAVGKDSNTSSCEEIHQDSSMKKSLSYYL